MSPSLTAAVLLASICGSLTAQTTANTAAVEEVKALEARLPAPKSPQGHDSFELSEARQQRLQKLLPNTWRKISQREPLHLLVIAGERELRVWSEDGKAGTMTTFPAFFSRELANQFFYTGGIFEAGKNAGMDVLAPGITLRVLAQGSGIIDAAAMLGSVARQAPVDLVLICHGLDEAESGMSPQAFTQAAGRAVQAAKALQAEVILCSPWLPMSAQPESVLGLTAPLSDALREAADEEGWAYADLGDLPRVLDLPPSDARDDAEKFARFASTYRTFFYETQDGSFLPRPALHARLGHALFEAMLDGHTSLPCTLSDVTATWRENGAALEASFTVTNPTSKSLPLTLLPLISRGWKPRNAQPEITLAAGANQTVTIQYARRADEPLPADENSARLPMLIVTGSHASVTSLRAPIQPVGIVWSTDTLFNQERRFVAGGQIINTSQQDLGGTWEASFAGATLNGKWDLKAGSTFPLDLAFDLPASGAAITRQPLKLSVKTSSLSLESTRQITLAPNLGLNQPIALTPEAASSGKVSLECRADAEKLTLTCDVSGSEMLLDAASSGAAAWQLEVNLDARSYGKRLEAGSTSSLRITGPATVGKAHLHDITAWAFGSGYSAVFSPKEFQTTHTSSGATQHQFQITLPRTYLYLHEWALDNGNSQFGLNVRLTLNTAQGYRTWTLAPTLKPANDAQAMAVLELTAKPTQRATVIME